MPEGDAEGELTSTTTGDDTASSVYDADGNRLVRTEAAGVTVFLPGGQEIRATSTAVQVTRSYTFGGTVVASRTGTGLAGVTSVVNDHHGTALASIPNLNWTAGVTRLRSDPFGRDRGEEAYTVAGRGYLGAPHDSTGFVQLGARYYDPTGGVFLSVDPLLDPNNPTTFNPYAYSGNNPTTFSDPTGLMYEGVGCGNCRGGTASIKEPKRTVTNSVASTVRKCSGYLPCGPAPVPACGSWNAHCSSHARGPSPEERELSLSLATMAIPGLGWLNLAKFPRIAALITKLAPLKKPLAPQKSGTQTARELGAAGELSAGIIKNTERISSATGAAPYRIPDVLDNAAGIIGEVKNVRYLSLTNQMRDFIAHAEAKGYTFQLFIRPSTTLSRPLQARLDELARLGLYSEMRTIQP